jgi:hypothetical protein
VERRDDDVVRDEVEHDDGQEGRQERHDHRLRVALADAEQEIQACDRDVRPAQARHHRDPCRRVQRSSEVLVHRQRHDCAGQGEREEDRDDRAADRAEQPEREHVEREERDLQPDL